MNFNQDFDKMLLEELSKYNYKVDPSLDSHEIRIKYFNFKKRIIPKNPRQVLLSKEFNCPLEFQAGFDLVKKKFAAGEDLIQHLSKSITNLEYNDGLLNDWGIFHLHLGEELEKTGSGFIDRSKLVLFVRVEKARALCINILPHGSWNQQKLVSVIHENWPDSIETYLFRDVIGLSHVPTDDEVKMMRKHGINSSIQITPGVVYAPIGGGLTVAKTSVEVTMQINNYYHFFEELEKYIMENAENIIRLINEKTEKIQNEICLNLFIEDHEYYVFQKETNVFFRLGRF